MPTTCLAMIVKDEAHVIARCLDSVLPFVRRAAIVDTGSTDATREIIRERCAAHSVILTLANETWVDFSTARNQAIEIAERVFSDYTFMIDADDQLVPFENFEFFIHMNIDVMNVEMHLGDTRYHRPAFWRTSSKPRYVGKVHEYLAVPDGMQSRQLLGCYVKAASEGARSKDADRWSKDAALLIEAIQDDPNDVRSMFYLAQSYGNIWGAEARGKALHWYRRRAEHPAGFQDERWYSLYRIARMTGYTDQFLKAFDFDRRRVEPLYWCAKILGNQSPSAHMMLHQANLLLDEPLAHTALFVESDLYAYNVRLEYAVTCYWQGHYETASDINKHLLTLNLPDHVRETVKTNQAFCKDRLTS